MTNLSFLLTALSDKNNTIASLPEIAKNKSELKEYILKALKEIDKP